MRLVELSLCEHIDNKVDKELCELGNELRIYEAMLAYYLSNGYEEGRLADIKRAINNIRQRIDILRNTKNERLYK